MKMLVTGGFGFIGSHLVERLIKDGHHVTVIDDSSTGQSENLSLISGEANLEIVNGSLLDEDSLENCISNVDYVFHLAAAVGVFNIVQNPLQSLLTNVRGTENVLSFSSKYKKPVFLTSSSEIYGKNTSDSLKEDSDRILGSPTVLRWSYSEAKAIDESLAYAYFVEKNLEVRIVRFFNTVGPRQLGSYGMVVPRFVKSALKNEPLVIYGDGKQTRCFAHILDVVEAIVLVAFAENTVGKVVNIGNDNEISMNDLAKKIIEETGSRSKIEHISYEVAYGHGFEDMDRRVPNIDLIRKLVGWRPTRNLSVIISDIASEMGKNI
jgi:UDP-glucose 4-epimerase